MDNTLTLIVGILGALIIGVVGTVVLIFLTQSAWEAVFGFAAWLGATAYLVRRRYLMDAVSKTACGIAVVPEIAAVFEVNWPRAVRAFSSCSWWSLSQLGSRGNRVVRVSVCS